MSKGFSKLFFGDTSIVVDIRNFSDGCEKWDV